jgi:hypothetical protein
MVKSFHRKSMQENGDDHILTKTVFSQSPERKTENYWKLV